MIIFFSIYFENFVLETKHFSLKYERCFIILLNVDDNVNSWPKQEKKLT